MKRGARPRRLRHAIHPTYLPTYLPACLPTTYLQHDDEVLAEGGDGAREHERVLDLLQDREDARQPAERVERVPG